jgi:hypothetical protein
MFKLFKNGQEEKDILINVDDDEEAYRVLTRFYNIQDKILFTITKDKKVIYYVPIIEGCYDELQCTGINTYELERVF